MLDYTKAVVDRFVSNLFHSFKKMNLKEYQRLYPGAMQVDGIGKTRN